MDLSEWSVSELSDLSDISYSDNVKNNQSEVFLDYLVVLIKLTKQHLKLQD